MNQVVLVNILRFVGISLLQVLILKRIDLSLGNFAYIHLIIYPYIILLLPFKINRLIVLVLGFTLGIFMDMFYNSPGIHAGAMVIMSYCRNFILKIFEPYEGYNQNESPTLRTMGVGWFLGYISTNLTIFMFAYFSLEAFSFIYIFDIVISTIFALIPSLLLIFIFQIITKPTY